MAFAGPAPGEAGAEQVIGPAQGFGEFFINPAGMPACDVVAGFGQFAILCCPAIQTCQGNIQVIDEAEVILKSSDFSGVLVHFDFVEQFGEKFAGVAQVFQGDP